MQTKIIADFNLILPNDKEAILEALRYDLLALNYASRHLYNNKDFMLAAIKINYWALSFASTQLWDDEEVIMASVDTLCESIKNNTDSNNSVHLWIESFANHASNRLQDDQAFFANILEKYSAVLKSKTQSADKEIFEQIKTVLAEQLKMPPQKITPDTSFSEDLWFDVDRMAMTLEQCFEIKVPRETAEQFLTVGDAVVYIAQYYRK